MSFVNITGERAPARRDLALGRHSAIVFCLKQMKGGAGLVLWASVLPRPEQHVRVPILSGPSTRPPVPGAVVLPGPHQHLQVPARRGVCTSDRFRDSVTHSVTMTRPRARGGARRRGGELLLD